MDGDQRYGERKERQGNHDHLPHPRLALEGEPDQITPSPERVAGRGRNRAEG
jgi:hypothetical protein